MSGSKIGHKNHRDVLRGLPLDALQKDPGALSIEQDGKYLHWDELKFRPKREAITHQEWWAIIKLARRNATKPFPLRDQEGRSFTFTMTDTIQRVVHEVDRDASGRIELPEDVTNKSTRDRYIVNSLIEEAITSSQLEGASTTRAVAKEMIRSKREPRTVDERMILNNFHAMEWVREHRSEELTTESVFELHSILTNGTLDEEDGAGRFRRADEDINVVSPVDGEIVHAPPHADSLAARMKAMCDFANGATASAPFIHPVVRSVLVHLWLAYDHPFVDGNGRTARALFYWSMLKQGYWLTEFISISRVIKKARSQYDRAFTYTESDDNDATYFLLNQLKVLRQAIDDLFAYLKMKAQQMREIEMKLRGRDDLNYRQLAVLSEALRHPDARITIESHQTTHRVVYETARTDLMGLAKGGYLEMTKSGRKLFFAPVRNIERRLKPKS
jgi:Fic family protein